MRVWPAKEPLHGAGIDHRVVGRPQGLALEQIHHGGDGLELDGLVRVELELHSFDGVVLRMKSANWGTVNSFNPCEGL